MKTFIGIASSDLSLGWWKCPLIYIGIGIVTKNHIGKNKKMDIKIWN